MRNEGWDCVSWLEKLIIWWCYLLRCMEYQFSSVPQSCLTLIPWTTARQASLSITNSQSLLKLMSIELVMPSNRLILCRPLLLPPSIFPSIRVFSNESALRGNGYPLQYSCLENSMDRGAWWTIVHGVVELDTTEWLILSLFFCIFLSDAKWGVLFLKSLSYWNSKTLVNRCFWCSWTGVH